MDDMRKILIIMGLLGLWGVLFPLYWGMEIVDNDSMYAPGMAGVSMDMDAKNHIHIAYSTSTMAPQSHELRYAHWDGTSWDIQKLDSGYAPCLRLDKEDHPHIVYSGIYRWWNGREWEIDTLTSKWNFLDFDTKDSPHIASIIEKEGHNSEPYDSALVAYLRRDKEDWEVEILMRRDESMCFGKQILSRPSLKMDLFDNPYMAVADARSLYYFKKIKEHWNTSTIERDSSESGTSQWQSLDVDKEGIPHILYGAYNDMKDEFFFRFRYANQEGDSWNIQTIDSIFRIDWIPRGHIGIIKLDDKGYPHIGYISPWNYCLYYQYWDGTKWHKDSPYRLGGAYRAMIPSLRFKCFSFTLDKDNLPHFVFLDGLSYTLLHAWGYPEGVKETEEPEMTPLHLTVKPNPLKGIFTISCALPEQGRVKLTIYNSLGKRVKILQDRILPPGIYEMDFNLKREEFNSGIYWFLLEQRKRKITEKIILAR